MAEWVKMKCWCTVRMSAPSACPPSAYQSPGISLWRVRAA